MWCNLLQCKVTEMLRLTACFFHPHLTVSDKNRAAFESRLHYLLWKSSTYCHTMITCLATVFFTVCMVLTTFKWPGILFFFFKKTSLLIKIGGGIHLGFLKVQTPWWWRQKHHLLYLWKEDHTFNRQNHNDVNSLCHEPLTILWWHVIQQCSVQIRLYVQD